MRGALLILATLLLSCGTKPKHPSKDQASSSVAQALVPAGSASASNAKGGRPYTDLFVHHVAFQETPALQLKIGWLRARMYPAQAGVNPSLDEPASMQIEIQDGEIGTSMSSLANVLNGTTLKGSNLSNVKLSPHGQQIELNAIVHKVVPLPIEMMADIKASPDGRIQIHIEKLSALKIPVKGLLNAIHVTAADLVDVKTASGVTVDGNDIYIDTSQIFPPPHNVGQVSAVHIANSGDVVVTYGNGREQAIKVEQWRNFIHLRGGKVTVGRLTMQDTDLTLIDTSADDWFYFDLPHYQEQLVFGYARMTPTAALQFFMPDITDIPKTKASESISLQWMKDRKAAPPSDVP